MSDLEYFSPADTWCGMKCIRDKGDCLFTETCGYRGKFLSAISNKQGSAISRYIRYNGRHDDNRQYISMKNLVELARVYLMTGFKCWYCGNSMTVGCNGDPNCSYTFTLDHRVPLACGGTNHISNFVYCCKRCNENKGKKEDPKRSNGNGWRCNK